MYKIIETNDHIIINAPKELWDAVRNGVVVTLEPENDPGKKIYLMDKPEAMERLEDSLDDMVEKGMAESLTKKKSGSDIIDFTKAKKRLRDE